HRDAVVHHRDVVGYVVHVGDVGDFLNRLVLQNEGLRRAGDRAVIAANVEARDVRGPLRALAVADAVVAPQRVIAPAAGGHDGDAAAEGRGAPRLVAKAAIGGVVVVAEVVGGVAAA